MTRAEMIELASPPCHECGQPGQRIEVSWARNTNIGWLKPKWFMVCPSTHRVEVKRFVP